MLICIVCLELIKLELKSKLFIHFSPGFYGFSVPEDIHVQLHTHQTGPYFWVKDRKKAVHVHIFTDELEKNKRKTLRQCLTR